MWSDGHNFSAKHGLDNCRAKRKKGLEKHRRTANVTLRIFGAPLVGRFFRGVAGLSDDKFGTRYR